MVEQLLVSSGIMLNPSIIKGLWGEIRNPLSEGGNMRENRTFI